MLNELVAGIVSALVLATLGASFRHRQYLKPALQCMFLYRNKKLRVSMAAILSIRRDDHYILINHRLRKERFGPIGGVYKYYPSALEQLDQCGFKPQVKDHTMKNDLRGFMQGKDFPSFMRWFLSGKNREVEPLTRELIEELEEIGLIKETEGIHALQYELLKIIYEGPQHVPGFDYVQFRYFGVYQFSPGDPKNEIIKQMLFRESERNPSLIAVTAEEIRLRRAISGELIATNSDYLISNKRIGTEPPPI